MMRTAQGTIKLMDLGIAKLLTESGLAGTINNVGALLYMSPEQATGTSLDARSDLYSVGVCLYEIVTGAVPFHADSEYTLMGLIVRRNPPPPVQVDPSVPKALNNVILRALEKNPATRFQTAEEFWAALVRPGSGEQALPSTAGLQTHSQASRGSTGSAPPQAPSPSTPAAASPPTSLRTPPEPIKRQGHLHLIVRAVLVITLAGFFAYEILKPRPALKQKPAGSKAEELSRQAVSPLAPTLKFPSGDMLLVPGGVALVGRDRHAVSVAPFYIDRIVVTEGAYRTFCVETGHPLPPGNQEAAANLPVVNITFDDARQFAKWANKRLPSAVEWEKAARGTDGRTYPWGNRLNFDLVNIPRDNAARKSAKLAPATADPSGASPYGALNMLGNVWQWIDTPVKVDFKEAASHFTSLKPPLSFHDQFYEVRGGSFRDVSKDPSSLIWDFVPTPARQRLPTIGFRCARDASR
jgi:eukaryotic-like serine/threonine-protein kinase